MKSFLFFLLFFLCAVFVQGKIGIDLVFLMVIYLGFFTPLFPGAVFVFLIGLGCEAVGTSWHGPLVISYLSTYLFLRMTHDKLLLEGVWAQAIWVSILSLVRKGIEAGLLQEQGYGSSFDFSWIFLALLQGILSLFLFPFLKNRGRMTFFHDRFRSRTAWRI